MNDSIEKIRNEIRRSGFLSAVQITVRFSQSGLDIVKIIRSLECGDIRHVEYTNSFVGPQKVKDLFYYNPNKRKKKLYTPTGKKKNANSKRKYTKKCKF